MKIPSVRTDFIPENKSKKKKVKKEAKLNKKTKLLNEHTFPFVQESSIWLCLFVQVLFLKKRVKK